LDKFESRSFDGIFLGYASHSHTYCVLNLETNRVVETCEVTFDETMPCSVPVFESAGDQEIDESIFVEENEEDVDWGDAEPTSSAALVESTMTTLAHGPDPSSSTTWGPCEPPPQLAPAAPEEALAAVEGGGDIFKGSTSAYPASPPASDYDRRHQSACYTLKVI
jgi:hypothetical protein